VHRGVGQTALQLGVLTRQSLERLGGVEHGSPPVVSAARPASDADVRDAGPVGTGVGHGYFWAAFDLA
jgi:hypothetical protein